MKSRRSNWGLDLKWLPGLCALLLVGQGCAPQERAVFHGESRTIHALTFTSDGRLLAATKSGLVQYRFGQEPETHGWNGLLDGRGIDDVWVREGQIFASDGANVGQWNGTRLLATTAEPPRPQMPVSLDSDGWHIPMRPVWPQGDSLVLAPDPSNKGTHVSAVTGNREILVAAWYGDGLWIGREGAWQRLPGAEDPAFREVRALAMKDEDLALATYTGEVWWRREGKWSRMPKVNAPKGSFYALSSYKGNIFGSTFENGLARWDGKSWSQTTFTSVHARQQAVFGGHLYVRQTTGEVDRYDGQNWVLNVFPWLLRGSATCLGVGDGKLLVGQYGGWSEFDGISWTHHLKLPELQGFVVTALAAQKGRVWVGSQEHGLYAFNRDQATLTVYDQRHGLGNDWVRSLLVDEGGVKVCMFLTGAYALKGDHFQRLTPDLSGEATGFARDPGSGNLFVGSREGLWRIEREAARRVMIGGFDKLEIQTLLAVQKGLWLGFPHGAAFVPWDLLRG